MSRRQLPIVLALGTTQTLAWASSVYLPALVADPIAHDLGISSNWIFGAYSAALVIAAILGPRGIRVNAIAPGIIDTDMSNFTKTEAGREVALGMQALKRLGKPEDIADVVAFLASDGASWITGASIPVDGGSKL